MVMQAYGTVSSPPVKLEEGIAGASTIYANKTSAKVSVQAPLFDYIDDNDCDVDSSTDKGTHSNFTAQQASPDLLYDMLTEENTEAIEDYVDNNISDEDSSADVGTHSNFGNQKARDSTYDTLTEANQANTYSLDATGGYMIVGDGTPDWGSVTGTISFWVKMDTSVQGRFWGQNGNMETRWSGTNLVLDWGATGSMTSAYSFTANKWYFVAIVWDENNNNLFLYVGDESDLPTLDANSQSGTWISTTPLPTQNRFLNSVGANEPVDGRGDDLRYWSIARTLAQMQSDYNTELTGSEANLMSYFKLSNDFDDIGPNDDDGSSSGSYSFSTDVPFTGNSDYCLDLEVQWTNVIDFLPMEKLCIYSGVLGSEDLRVDYWNGTGWENLATDLTAYSCNEYTVSLTSENFTIRFKGGTETSDTTQDQWQIDASLLRVEGAGSKEDAVDQQSNIDGSADVGTHGNFSALQYGPDLINDTLTETNTGGASNTTLIDAESFEGAWPPSGWTETGNWNGEVDQAYDGTRSADFDGPGFGTASGDLDTPNLNCTGVSAIYVDFWYRDHLLDADDFLLQYYNGGGWNTISDLGSTMQEDQWLHYQQKITDGQYFVSTFRVRWSAVSVSSGENIWVDLVTIKKEISAPDNYELDLEVQWTDVPYLLPNEELSIYGGTMGVENIRVDIWNGTGWENVFNDLSNGWNNQSITDWLTSSTIIIRFKGGNETGDTNQDTWQIDVALIHVWHDGGESYEFDVEVQWTNTDYTRSNEELCIRTGTFSGSENIQVRVWNNAGSSWHWIMNLTASQWNNVSITPYLTSSTFTVQFLGGTETGDTAEDTWRIDATLLHVWTDGATFNYVLRVNNTDADPWQIRLKKYSDSNINRLQNCTIYFHNSSDGTSRQIHIEDGSYIIQTGSWYDLGGSETIYIAITVEATSTGTSYVRTYLEILIPGKTTYARYILTFEFT
jgi:hypothetical protein